MSGTTGASVTGNNAGWLLAFRREEANGDLSQADDPVEFSCEDVYGDLRATLPNGLEGGTYTFTIEGITDADYKRLSLSDAHPLRVRLYLYWRDALDPGSSVLGNLAAYGANLLGTGGSHPSRADALPPEALVAELRVTAVSRRAGARRYELQVTARERVFDLAANSVLGTGELPETFQALVTRVLQGANLGGSDQFQFHPPTTVPADVPSLTAGQTVVAVLNAVGGRLEDADNGAYGGRKVFLIRNGVLHVGIRPIPLAGAGSPPIVLDEAGGLLEITTGGRVAIDPNFDRLANPGKQPDTRLQFRVLCKGRPDVKPGDLVSFRPPEEDASTTPPLGGGIVGAVAAFVGSQVQPTGDPVVMYVESVEHKLSRTDAFVSTITGVVVDAAKPWDKHTVFPGGSKKGQQTSAGAEQSVVESARRAIDRALGSRRLVEVGEIRDAQAADGQSPGQTVTAWEGLAAPPNAADAGARQAARLDVARPSQAPARGVPYLTPFAWGPCGLLIPQLPGARVAIDHRGGAPDDPIVLGQLWQNAHAPQNGQAGDWWLILPVGAPTSSLADGNDPPPSFSGDATNDLIDADGNRAVEATTFVVRAGDLESAGTRPEVLPSDTALQLVQKNGSATTSITLKTDGSVQITTSKGISIDAQEDISISTQGAFNIRARSVAVKVDDVMDVSKA